MFCTHRDDYEAEVFLLYVESNQSNDGWLFLFLHGLPSPNITSRCLLLLTFSIIIFMQLSYIVWQSKIRWTCSNNNYLVLWCVPAEYDDLVSASWTQINF